MTSFQYATPNPSSPDSVESHDVTLGMDIGSTSTRAYLWCPKTKVGWYVESETRPKTGHRFSNGDFSSLGYPFDGGEVYLGERSDASRQSISLKYAFYILAHAADELFKQYRLVTPLRAHQNDQQFRDRLVEGIKQLFTAVRKRVAQVCEEENLRVTNIGLSIPSQWTLDFMDIYRSIVVQVFSHDPDAIFFVTETEALAHFLCVKKLDRLVERRNTVHHAVVLVLDFGGHNMVSNTCILNIVYGGDRAPAFYLIGEPDGVGGGSELWEYLVAEMSIKYVERVHGLSPSPAIRQKLLDSFNVAKGGCGPEFPGQGFDYIVRDHLDCTHNVILDEPRITACFNEAMALPINLAATKIGELGTMLDTRKDDHPSTDIQPSASSGKPRVILAGGSARHEGVRKRVEAACRHNNLSDPVMTDNIINQYDSVKIASGAAFAVASPLTLDQFMRRGAAFGLQMRQGAARNIMKSEQPWDNTALFLLSMWRKKENLEIPVRGDDELKIVCDPFFEHDSNPNKEQLHYHKCYDIAHLGRPTIGRWWFTLALSGHGNQMWLTIERSRQPTRSPKGRKGRILYDPITVPLHFNRGSNSIHIGEEASDANKYISRLKDYPERNQKTLKRKVPPLNEKPGAFEEPDAFEEPGAFEEPDAFENPGIPKEISIPEKPDVSVNPSLPKENGIPEWPRLTARRSKKKPLTTANSNKTVQIIDITSPSTSKGTSGGNENDAGDDSRDFSFVADYSRFISGSMIRMRTDNDPDTDGQSRRFWGR
ncbi:hypothetical protein SCAR479_01907 [Seiridium cardinale]|uniref:Actin-like ATPase domain-containing protein n=1 Tax=Seiridium cardinale TaxID=138064 RepID=A0ABR2Y4A4_9PEZI